MKRQAVESLSSVIKANSERVTLEQLAQKGKKHVRVVSSDKVMRLIQAIVDDAIDREASEQVKDRDRLVSETKQQFDRVLKIQAEQDQVLQKQRDLAEQYKQQLQLAQEQIKDMDSRYQKEREEQAARGGELIAEYEERLARAKRERDDLEKKLSTSGETIQNFDQELGRMSEQLAEEREKLVAREAELRAEHQQKFEEAREQAREELKEAEARAKSLEEELQTALRCGDAAAMNAQGVEKDLRNAEAEVGKAREAEEEAKRRAEAYGEQVQMLKGQLEQAAKLLEEQKSARDQTEAESVAQLRDELSEVKNLVREFAMRPSGPDEETLQSIVQKLGERDAASQERFDEQLDRTLDEINKSIKRATAGPIDVVVEATDVLVDRLFDHDEEMKTNLDDLDVEERKSKTKIASSLERLKAAQQASQSED